MDSRLPLERVEILVNGEIVATRENTEKLRHWSFDGTLEIGDSSWVAARAYARQELPYQYHLSGTPSIVFAHSSPVYVAIDGRARSSARDAAFLAEICERTIRWAKTAARYHDSAQRQQVVELYDNACSVYRKQMREGT
jgi:hypothetical protein